MTKSFGFIHGQSQHVLEDVCTQRTACCMDNCIHPFAHVNNVCPGWMRAVVETSTSLGGCELDSCHVYPGAPLTSPLLSPMLTLSSSTWVLSSETVSMCTPIILTLDIAGIVAACVLLAEIVAVIVRIREEL